MKATLPISLAIDVSSRPEIIRYQSPVVHMRRTALCDAELNGIRAY